MLDTKDDWRNAGYYISEEACCICKSTTKIGMEPRFGYSVCEEHAKWSPVKITEAIHERNISN